MRGLIRLIAALIIIFGGCATYRHYFPYVTEHQKRQAQIQATIDRLISENEARHSASGNTLKTSHE